MAKVKRSHNTSGMPGAHSTSGLSMAVESRAKKEETRLQAELAQHLRDDMLRMMKEEILSDLLFTNGHQSVPGHQIILKSRMKDLVPENWFLVKDGMPALHVELQTLEEIQEFVSALYTDDKLNTTSILSKLKPKATAASNGDTTQDNHTTGTPAAADTADELHHTQPPQPKDSGCLAEGGVQNLDQNANNAAATDLHHSSNSGDVDSLQDAAGTDQAVTESNIEDCRSAKDHDGAGDVGQELAVAESSNGQVELGLETEGSSNGDRDQKQVDGDVNLEEASVERPGAERVADQETETSLGVTTHLTPGDSSDQGEHAENACSVLGSDLLHYYHRGIDTDCCLVAEGKRFPAHRCILAARCQYFDAMFTGSWCESSEMEIELQGVRAQSVECILQFVYGAMVQMDTGNIAAVLQAVDMFGMEGLKEWLGFQLARDLCHFFHKPCQECIQSVPDVLVLSSQFNLTDLLARTKEWVARHFRRIWETQAFSTLPAPLLDICTDIVIEGISMTNITQVILDAHDLARLLQRFHRGEQVHAATIKVLDAALAYCAEHFLGVVKSPQLLSWSKGGAWCVDVLSESYMMVVSLLQPEVACEVYSSLRQRTESMNREEESMQRSIYPPEVTQLLTKLVERCEWYLQRYIHRVVQCPQWASIPSDIQKELLQKSSFVPVQQASSNAAQSRVAQKLAAALQQNIANTVNMLCDTNPTLFPSLSQIRAFRPSELGQGPARWPENKGTVPRKVGQQTRRENTAAASTSRSSSPRGQRGKKEATGVKNAGLATQTGTNGTTGTRNASMSKPTSTRGASPGNTGTPNTKAMGGSLSKEGGASKQTRPASASKVTPKPSFSGRVESSAGARMTNAKQAAQGPSSNAAPNAGSSSAGAVPRSNSATATRPSSARPSQSRTKPQSQASGMAATASGGYKRGFGTSSKAVAEVSSSLSRPSSAQARATEDKPSSKMSNERERGLASYRTASHRKVKAEGSKSVSSAISQSWTSGARPKAGSALTAAGDHITSTETSGEDMGETAAFDSRGEPKDLAVGGENSHTMEAGTGNDCPNKETCTTGERVLYSSVDEASLVVKKKPDVAIENSLYAVANQMSDSVREEVDTQNHAHSKADTIDKLHTKQGEPRERMQPHLPTPAGLSNVCETEREAGVTDDQDTTESGEDSHRSYGEFEAGRWVLLVYRPLCAVTGVIGNTLCVTVVVKSQLRHSPTAIYMVTLAVLDLLLSVVGFLHILPTDAAVGEGEFFTQTWHCRLFFFTLLFLAHFDVLVLVAMTGQRYVAIAFPLQAAAWNSKRLTVGTVCVAAVVSFLVNWPHLVMLSARPFTGKYRSTCDGNSAQARHFYKRVYPWVDSSLYIFFPIIAIAVFNVLIYRSIHKVGEVKFETNHTVRQSTAVVSSPFDSSSCENEMKSPVSMSLTTSTVSFGSRSSLRGSRLRGVVNLNRATDSCDTQKDEHPDGKTEAKSSTSSRPPTLRQQGTGRDSDVSSGVLMELDSKSLPEFPTQPGIWTSDNLAFMASENGTQDQAQMQPPSSMMKICGAVLIPRNNGSHSRQDVQGKDPEISTDSSEFGLQPKTDTPTETEFSDTLTKSEKYIPPQELPSVLRRHGTSTSTKSSRSAQQITRMLVCVSVAFVVLTSPVGVFILTLQVWNPATGHGRAVLSLLSVVSESLMYTNHSVNSILYCLTGTRFRRAAPGIVCRCLRMKARHGSRNSRDINL
ncbi:hypothetical protein BaRGS_00011705 [Batillaria attramentaria]|uniref:G-protein coupled receptors family 1 profile domain-containing protein n=1 Tax=Batillaria attramentaria TaxID=370345 RepID=A0ABD0LC03_9CAEN